MLCLHITLSLMSCNMCFHVFCVFDAFFIFRAQITCIGVAFANILSLSCTKASLKKHHATRNVENNNLTNTKIKKKKFISE